MKKVICALLSLISLNVFADNGHLDLQISGLSYHFQQPKNSNYHWNQENTGLGLQYVQPNDNWVNKFFAGSLKDSNYYNGWYIGASKEYIYINNSILKASAGLSLIAMHRAIDFNRNVKNIVAPLPTFSFNDSKDNFGVNIIFIPKVSFDGYSSPNTIFGQLTIKIKDI